MVAVMRSTTTRMKTSMLSSPSQMQTMLLLVLAKLSLCRRTWKRIFNLPVHWEICLVSPRMAFWRKLVTLRTMVLLHQPLRLMMASCWQRALVNPQRPMKHLMRLQSSMSSLNQSRSLRCSLWICPAPRVQKLRLSPMKHLMSKQMMQRTARRMAAFLQWIQRSWTKAALIL